MSSPSREIQELHAIRRERDGPSSSQSSPPMSSPRVRRPPLHPRPVCGPLLWVPPSRLEHPSLRHYHGGDKEVQMAPMAFNTPTLPNFSSPTVVAVVRSSSNLTRTSRLWTWTNTPASGHPSSARRFAAMHL
jgi:hypothetical protein